MRAPAARLAGSPLAGRAPPLVSRGAGCQPPSFAITGAGTWLEVELGDVGGVEDEGRAEQDRVVRADRVAAELAGGELVAGAALDLAGGQLDGGVGGQVAQVGRVPQLELLARAVGDVLLHLVRGAQAGERDLAAVLG